MFLSELSRREFLSALSRFGLLAALPAPLAAADTLPQRAIPATGEMLPVIGLGSTKAVRRILHGGRSDLAAVMRMLMQYGGRVVDTAPRPADIDAAFGSLLGEAQFRDLFVTAKINATGRDAGIAQFRQTRRLFGRRTLDLVQIESLTDLYTHWPSLQDWKHSGEARYIGVTVAHEALYGKLETFMRREQPDFVQVNYSVVETSAEQRILPLARDRGCAVLINSPFMNGHYFADVKGRSLPDWTGEFDCGSWAQFSLKYILANPAVTCVLTETTRPAHMEDNLRAAFGRLPDADMRGRMRELAEGFGRRT